MNVLPRNEGGLFGTYEIMKKRFKDFRKKFIDNIIKDNVTKISNSIRVIFFLETKTRCW